MFYDTVIQGAEILDRNDGKTYQVGIKDGRIAYIGQEPVQGSLVIDGRDHLLAPGLVNAHTHIAMTLFRSLPMIWSLWTGCRTKSGPWRIISREMTCIGAVSLA